ncbi:endolytic transglycosylase MltG [bacterium]|nr:endolytic transglycosylase MltG [bacterium]
MADGSQRTRNLVKILVVVSFLGILLGASFVAAFYKIVLYNAPAVELETLPLDKKLRITIPKGASLSDIAHILEESGVIDNSRTFIYAAQYLGADRHLKAGQYLLPLRGSNHQILRILQSSTPQSIRITITEGKKLGDIIAVLQAKLPIDPSVFAAAVSDTELCRELGIADTSLFGYMMPNTYFFDPGTTEKEIIRIMVREFTAFFDGELKQRAAALRMTPKQIVTLASIIEGETSNEEERYTVSAVYHNRLKNNMLLQADPTIQFIIKDGPRRLYFKDLDIDSPYNTYKYSGLPPGPINNPGKPSILAALYPASVDYLYMVADGTGKHRFSRTMEEHLEARKQLDRLRQNIGQQNSK